MTTSIDYGMLADETYWEGLKKGRLLMQRCASCADWPWPAVYRCPTCGAWELEWQEVPPTGTIFSWTRMWQPVPGLEPLGLPFVSVVVELDQANRNKLMGTVVGDVEKLAIGAAVTGEVIERTLNNVTRSTLVWRLS